MPKHSQGPWFVRGTLIECPKHTIAAMSKAHRATDPWEADANARLIAAAPRLLFALKQAVELTEAAESERPHGEGSPQTVIDWVSDAHAALALVDPPKED